LARKSRKGIHKLPAAGPKVFNAGLYARISMNADGKSLSVLNQIEHMRKFLSQHEDIILTGIYADDGVSSFSKNRPVFTRMIKDMHAKKIDCIIVNEISRFSREYIEASEYLEITFPTLQVRFIIGLLFTLTKRNPLASIIQHMCVLVVVVLMIFLFLSIMNLCRI